MLIIFLYLVRITLSLKIILNNNNFNVFTHKSVKFNLIADSLEQQFFFIY